MNITKQNQLAQPALDPEIVNWKRMNQVISISRSHAYNLAKQGLIKSFVLRQKGKVRGKRLWDLNSVREYVRSCAVSGGSQ